MLLLLQVVCTHQHARIHSAKLNTSTLQLSKSSSSYSESTFRQVDNVVLNTIKFFKKYCNKIKRLIDRSSYCRSRSKEKPNEMETIIARAGGHKRDSQVASPLIE